MDSTLEIPGLDEQDIALVLNARNFAYYCDMVEQIRRGECPFCTLDPEKNVVIQSFGQWRVWECPEAFRAKHVGKHFIIAPKEHLTHVNSMFLDDWYNLASLIDWITKNAESGVGLSGGAIMMRFGDPHLNAQSIRHLHANIYVPDGTGEVKLTIAKDPTNIAKKLRIVKLFEVMRRYKERSPGLTPRRLLDGLTKAERALVEDRMG